MLEHATLFASGQGGYTAYRIPALVTTRAGTVLAFCEGRKDTFADTGEIHILLRRSFDSGRTWQEPQIVAQEPQTTCGNPCPVVDRATGAILLPFCKNRSDGPELAIIQGKAPRTAWLTRSDDDGATWCVPEEITAAVKSPGWTWYATGPGHGIQLVASAAGGPSAVSASRLIVPCNHIVGVHLDPDRDPYHSHVIYSDDHGRNWSIGGIVSEGGNECEVVELEDGTIYLNARNWRERGVRCVAWSTDGGLTFGPRQPEPALTEPPLWGGCQGSMIRYRRAGEDCILFANPAWPEEVRRNMTVRVSRDGCKTWSAGKSLHAGPAAYSDLAVAPDGNILCLYERGHEHPYETLTLARFNVQWLSE